MAAKHTAAGGVCAGLGLLEVLVCGGGARTVSSTRRASAMPEERGSVAMLSAGGGFSLNKPFVLGPLKDFMTATYIYVYMKCA